ncbi:N-methyl-L-tryptophan oxidase [Lentibacillus sp.]|uniref:N-methyl-L-tryptophan oxidase n=1 Tax=Lentibacillus sp. TaxID=1925746 RepID=UPI002B4AEC18|nr:N-methyl-L-tryptophan oxidase [Lentibacillus sp.]HLS08341.1 N-methyl-L-tryptophan oxidase [Lentibacillus sp.]
MDADVAVVGVGTMGSMATWQLAKAGISVIAFEQFGIGNDRTAAGGESRLFRTAYMEGKEYVPLLFEAKNLWRQLEAETNRELLTLNGGLTIGDPDTDVMKSLLKSIYEFELDHEILQGKEATERFPQHRLFSEDIMVLDKNAGFLRPELAVVSAVERAESLGANIKRYTTVQGVHPDKDGVTIIANDKEYHVGKVLITTGAWTGELLPRLRDHLIARRLVLTWFAPKNVEKFKPDKFPIFARMRKGYRLTGAPTLDGTMVKASNTKDPEAVLEPGNLNRDVSSEELQEVGDAVEKLLPGLEPNPVRASVYMDAYTEDDHSILGKLPGMDNTFLISGFSGHGFKMSPVIGKIAVDLITKGETKHSIGHLNPYRYAKA